MNDAAVEWTRDGWVISTDRRRLDPAAVLALLRATHWGGDLTFDRLARAVEHSLRRDSSPARRRWPTSSAGVRSVRAFTPHRADDGDGADGLVANSGRTETVAASPWRAQPGMASL